MKLTWNNSRYRAADTLPKNPCFKMVLHDIEFWPFLGSLAFDLPQCQQRWSQLELPKNKEQKKTKKNNTERKTKTNRNKTTKKDGCGTNKTVCVHKNMTSARLGVQAFRCSSLQVLRWSGFRCSGLLTFWKVKRVTREGAQKWPKFNMG